MRTASVFLKARPTAAQIADRLAPPVPAGLEFYLDSRDIAGDGWLDRLTSLVLAERPAEFDFVVEGPLRSLDGAFFDATLPNEANLAVLDRLVAFGARVGAKAAVIHAMAARPSAAHFDRAAHADALAQSQALFRYYVNACQSAGLIPTVENVPPVARMREGSFMYSLIGANPGDILHLVRAVPGLRVTLDVSHAQLYVNAFTAERDTADPALRPMLVYLQGQDGVTDVDGYIAALAGYLTEAHISNAEGLLGEGLPYDRGELDLDRVIRKLNEHVSFLVTETIEPDADRAIFMREAQRRIGAALLGL